MGDPLHDLARLHGVQLSYRDVFGRRRRASRETLLGVLGALGVPVERPAQAAALLREETVARRRRLCEPVAVGWGGEPVEVEVRLPRRVGGPTAVLEPEGEESTELNLLAAPVVREERVDGAPVVVRLVRLDVPPGYHRLRLEAGGRSGSALVVSAPRRVAPLAERAWGAFLPLYALRTARDWGVGDLTDLGSLAELTAGFGARVVGTLPLFAAFLDEPYDHSPYSPVSRLFWNELYLDVERLPELEASPQVRELVGSEGFREEVAARRRAGLVDYRGVMALKRRVLERLAEALFAGGGARRDALERWARGTPGALEYARFRAAAERYRAGWPDWPEPQRGGRLGDADVDEGARRYHLYVQWVAKEQMAAAAARAERAGVALYLDMPVGVHAGGFDVWRERAAFALGVSAGAPPDAFFGGGQDWGFPPLHPERTREQGYRYPIACLRHLMRHAGMVRIDHVMGFHRLFWVPQGLPPTEGAYVGYPADELYAVLCLESARAGAAVAGEDLGTVPARVRRAMAAHGVLRTYVLQFEVSPRRPPGTVPSESVASLNTHDMPPFAAFWTEADIDHSAPWQPPAEVRRARAERARGRAVLARFLQDRGLLRAADGAGPPGVAAASLFHLASSDARAVVVSVEDLWEETEPQNVPGVTDRPNWRRKARYPLEAWGEAPAFADRLREVDRLRREGP